MTVGAEKNNVVSGVTSASVFSVHLQHNRLAKPTVQSTHLTGVTTFFYQPQTGRALADRKIFLLPTQGRVLASYAFVNRDVLYPTAHCSPGLIDLIGDASVTIAGLTKLDRPLLLRCIRGAATFCIRALKHLQSPLRYRVGYTAVR